MSYTCRYLGPGTKSAGPCLTPMFAAWGKSKGYVIHSGTLNLCAEDPIQVPAQFHSLKDYGHLVTPEWRQLQNGFSPRFYDVLLNEREPAWLYRWSASEFLSCFVGHANDCPPEHRAEIVASKQLTEALELSPGDTVALTFSS